MKIDLMGKQKHFFDLTSNSEAIEFIQDSIKDEIAFVGFSGGKDSICIAELMKMSGVKYELYYSFTGLDAPEVVKFIRQEYPECKFLMPRFTFWRKLSVNVPPSDNIRWCCTSLKKESAWKLLHTKRIMGIRTEESWKRNRYGRVNHFEKLKHTHYYPIYNWPEWRVWEFIEEYNLKYPILYDWGFDRIGCIVCPFHSGKNGQLHKMYRDRWPKYFLRFERGIKELYNKRVSQGKHMHYSTPEKFLEAWYLNNCARWYKEE